MRFKKTVILTGTFIFAFILFNLVPFIPVQYDVGEFSVLTGHPTERICSLNYFTCMSSLAADNFPSILKNDVLDIFILPILIPVLITVGGYYLFLIDKRRKKRR